MLFTIIPQLEEDRANPSRAAISAETKGFLKVGVPQHGGSNKTGFELIDGGKLLR